MGAISHGLWKPESEAFRGPEVEVRSRLVRLEAPVLSGQQVLQMLSERRRAAKEAEIAWSQVVEGQSCPGGRERRSARRVDNATSERPRLWRKARAQ